MRKITINVLPYDQPASRRVTYLRQKRTSLEGDHVTALGNSRVADSGLVDH